MPLSDPAFLRIVSNRWTAIHVLILLFGINLFANGLTGFFADRTIGTKVTVIEKTKGDTAFLIRIEAKKDGKTLTHVQEVPFSRWMMLETGKTYPAKISNNTPRLLPSAATAPGISTGASGFFLAFLGFLIAGTGAYAVYASGKDALRRTALLRVARRTEATVITLSRRLSGKKLFFFPNVRIEYVFTSPENGIKQMARTKLMFERTARKLCNKKPLSVLYDPKGMSPPLSCRRTILVHGGIVFKR